MECSPAHDIALSRLVPLALSALTTVGTRHFIVLNDLILPSLLSQGFSEVPFMCRQAMETPWGFLRGRHHQLEIRFSPARYSGEFSAPRLGLSREPNPRITHFLVQSPSHQLLCLLHIAPHSIIKPKYIE